MIIVISNPTAIRDEHTFINALFDEGLHVFHLRKPDYSADELEELLCKINVQHHSKIALHQHHQLAKQFDMTRFHYAEENRIHLNSLPAFKTNAIFSTSVHDTQTITNLLPGFNYCFLSPLFDSISKPAYKSFLTPDFKLFKKSNTQVIALGGINSETVTQVKQYDFDGIALLGSIWTEPKKSLVQFKTIRQQWNN